MLFPHIQEDERSFEFSVSSQRCSVVVEWAKSRWVVGSEPSWGFCMGLIMSTMGTVAPSIEGVLGSIPPVIRFRFAYVGLEQTFVETEMGKMCANWWLAQLLPKLMNISSIPVISFYLNLPIQNLIECLSLTDWALYN